MTSLLLSECFPAYTVKTLERMIAAAKPFPLDFSYAPSIETINNYVIAQYVEEYEDGEQQQYKRIFFVAPDGYVSDISDTVQEEKEQNLLNAIDTAIKAYLDCVGDTADNRAFMIENVTALIQYL